MSGNKRLYTTMKCRSMTTKEEMISNKEYGKQLEDRLVTRIKGYYKLYADKTGLISATEITTLRRKGYKLNTVGIDDGKVYALFFKKNE